MAAEFERPRPEYYYQFKGKSWYQVFDNLRLGTLCPICYPRGAIWRIDPLAATWKCVNMVDITTTHSGWQLARWLLRNWDKINGEAGENEFGPVSP